MAQTTGNHSEYTAAITINSNTLTDTGAFVQSVVRQTKTFLCELLRKQHNVCGVSFDPTNTAHLHVEVAYAHRNKIRRVWCVFSWPKLYALNENGRKAGDYITKSIELRLMEDHAEVCAAERTNTNDSSNRETDDP